MSGNGDVVEAAMAGATARRWLVCSRKGLLGVGVEGEDAGVLLGGDLGRATTAKDEEGANAGERDQK